MKNIDGKKLLALIGIILVIALIIFIVFKGVNKNGITKEDKELAEKYALTYVVNLTENYNTPYNGTEKLFQQEETTYTDLNATEIINVAIKYIENTNMDASINEETLRIINRVKDINNFDEYKSYNGETVREAVKAIFGNVTYNDFSATEETNYLYDFIYNKKYDIYLSKRNNVKEYETSYQSLEFSKISTTVKDEKIIVTIAVAYVYDDGSTRLYGQDKNGENIIVEEVDEIPSNKVNEFDKFEISFTKSDDENIAFESIKKVK